MTLKEMLSPQFQRRYDKALRDWEAGRNLEEAAVIIYRGVNKRSVARLIQFRKDEAANRRAKGKKLVVEGLGTLTHNGEEFVVKRKTLVYPKSSVVVSVDPKLAHDESIGRLWGKFCRRERSLVRELEAAISKYYRKIRRRPSMASVDLLPPLKRNSDIWVTLGKPEISFCQRDHHVDLQLTWNPAWEEEHGLYVYLSRDAKIRRVGEFGEFS